MSIFVSGSLAMDRIMDFPGKFSDHILPDKIHVLNVCFNVNGLKEHFGGTAGNIGYGLAQLNEKPVLLASAGKDFAPYRAWLEKNLVVCDFVKIVDNEFTASAYITTDQSDNQITGFNPGAMKHPTYFEFEGPGAHSSIGIVAAGNLDDMRGYAARFRENSIPYILDPGQSLNIWDGPSMIKALTGSKIFISNDYELDLTLKLTGLTLSSLKDKTEAVVTTKGEEGSVISTKSGEIKIPVVKADRVLDPTGAGDAYRAGLIKGLIMGKDLLECGRMGSTIASFAVEVYGTQEYTCTQDQFRQRYETAFGPLT